MKIKWQVLILIFFVHISTAIPCGSSTAQTNNDFFLIRTIVFLITTASLIAFLACLIDYYRNLFKNQGIRVRNWVTEREWDGRVEIQLETFYFE